MSASDRTAVRAAVRLYRNGGRPALQQAIGTDQVDASLYEEAIRQLAIAQAPRGGEILAPLRRRWAWQDFESSEATAEARAIARGGNR